MVLLIIGIFLALGLATWLRPWPLFPAVKIAPDVEPGVALEFREWVARQAQKRGLNARGVARIVPLECPRCHKSSNYFVYPAELCERCWQAELRAEAARANANHPQSQMR